MFLIFTEPRKSNEPERAYVHCHVKNSNRCYFIAHEKAAGFILHRNFLFAEAFEVAQIEPAVKKIAEKYNLLDVIVEPTRQYDALFSIPQMKLLKMI